MGEANISGDITNSEEAPKALRPSVRLACNILLFCALIFGGSYGLLYSQEMSGWISCEMHKSGKLCQIYSREKGSSTSEGKVEALKNKPSSGEQSLVKLIVFFCTLSLALGISQPLTLLIKYLSLKLDWSLKIDSGGKERSNYLENLPGLTVLGSVVVSVVVSISVSVENPDARALSAEVLALKELLAKVELDRRFNDLSTRVGSAESNLANSVKTLQGEMIRRQGALEGHMAALENIYAGERWESLRSNIDQVVKEGYEGIEREIARSLVESEKWERLLERRQSLEKPLADSYRLEMSLKEADFNYRKCTEPFRSFLFFVSSEGRKSCNEEYTKKVAAAFEQYEGRPSDQVPKAEASADRIKAIQ